jgi:hypothetical protein
MSRPRRPTPDRDFGRAFEWDRAHAAGFEHTPTGQPLPHPAYGFIEDLTLLLGHGAHWGRYEQPVLIVEIDGLSEILAQGQNGCPFLLCDEVGPAKYVARQWQRVPRQPGPGQAVVAFPPFPTWLRKYPRRTSGLPDWDWGRPGDGMLTTWPGAIPIAGSDEPVPTVRARVKFNTGV